ncbi:hypothetical protein FF1_006845 [Malus domestica]
MCVSSFGALFNAEKTNRPDPPPGFSKLSVSEAEKSIAGNLCRCTGYRPIADACKSFAADVDMEGLGFNSFWKKGDNNIDLRCVPELSMIKIDPTGAEFGAIVTISKVIESLRKNDNGGSPSRGGDVLKNIAIHMEKIASGFIRNTASIGGNLVMAQRKCFPSDIATILLAVDSEVDIMNGARSETIMLEDFLKRPPLDPKSVLKC